MNMNEKLMFYEIIILLGKTPIKMTLQKNFEYGIKSGPCAL